MEHNSKTAQAIVEKARADLELLRNGRDNITVALAHSDIEDEETQRKLNRLDASIDKLENLIGEFENQYMTHEDSDEMVNFSSVEEFEDEIEE